MPGTVTADGEPAINEIYFFQGVCRMSSLQAVKLTSKVIPNNSGVTRLILNFQHKIGTKQTFLNE